MRTFRFMGLAWKLCVPGFTKHKIVDWFFGLTIWDLFGCFAVLSMLDEWREGGGDIEKGGLGLGGWWQIWLPPARPSPGVPPPLGEELDGKDSCPCLPDCHCVVGILTFGTCLGIIYEQTWDLGPMGGRGGSLSPFGYILSPIWSLSFTYLI